MCSFTFVAIQMGGRSYLVPLSGFFLFMGMCFEHAKCAPKFCENLFNFKCFVYASVGALYDFMWWIETPGVLVAFVMALSHCFSFFHGVLELFWVLPFSLVWLLMNQHPPLYAVSAMILFLVLVLS